MVRIFRWLTDLKKICPACDGAGVVICSCNENHELLCPNCGGKGSVEKKVIVNQKMEVPCDNPGCEKGKVSCALCHGSGHNHHNEVCRECRGRGMVDCPVCCGLGKIKQNHQESWITHETCHLCHGHRYVPCYHCHGTKERICPECKGEGVVWNQGKIICALTLAALILAIPLVFTAIAGVLLSAYVFCWWKDIQAAKRLAKEESAAVNENMNTQQPKAKTETATAAASHIKITSEASCQADGGITETEKQAGN